jgi:phage shock protein PspC (stress-responsive transcriptional regulator)
MNTTEQTPAADTTDTTSASQSAGTSETATPRSQQLYRPLEGRMVAGVGAGIARYLGVDVTIVRIGLVVLTIIGGAGLPLYLAGWLLMPEEGSDESIASDFIGSRQARSH